MTATTNPISPDQPIAASLPLAIKARIVRLLLVAGAAFLCNTAAAQSMPASPEAAVNVQVPLPLAFRDFFKLPVGPRGLETTATLQHAHGKTVHIRGYMVHQEMATPGEFLLTPRPVQMSEHADGEADDLPATTVRVRLAESQANWVVPHVRGLIQLQGVLSVARQIGPDGRVSWVQLQLPPEAARSMQLTEQATPRPDAQHAH